MIDTFISNITDVREHPNADSLELATVNNWQVVVPKGVYNNNDYVLYIVPDAMLPLEREWVQPFTNYLGKHGRVKTVKLRGEFSNGIVIPFDKANEMFFADTDEAVRIHYKNDLRNYAEGDFLNQALANILGIEHYNPLKHSSVKGVLSGDVLHAGLPFGAPKTDEENWQSLPESMLGIGESCFITCKMDGSSLSMTATPSGEFFVSSRNQTFKDYVENTYVMVAQEHKDKLLAYAKKHNKTIIAQGEMTGAGINSSKVNIDSVGIPKFNLFGFIFPDETDIALRNGWYGTDNHFSVVNEELQIPTVPVLENTIISKAILQAWTNAPASEGEGIVVDTKNGSYKVKSSDYYSKLK